MKHAQFFQLPVKGYGTELIEACGDRSVIVLDGRECNISHHTITTNECRKRGFLAYQLRKGRSFSDAENTSVVIPVKP